MNARSTHFLLLLLPSLGGGVLPLAEAPRCLAGPGRTAEGPSGEKKPARGKRDGKKGN
jgi:hypothetical protein